MNKITQDKWEELSDAMVEITRSFNVEDNWQTWTTPAWRMMSDESLRELLDIIDVKVDVISVGTNNNE